MASRRYQAALGLAVVLIGAAYLYGKHEGQREAPRVITDRQACSRWAGRCIAVKGRPWLDRWKADVLPMCEMPNVRVPVE